jgi:hypothetical protein
MKDDDMYTRSDEEQQEKASRVVQGYGICDMVCMEDEKENAVILSCLKPIQICVLLW